MSSSSSSSSSSRGDSSRITGDSSSGTGDSSSSSSTDNSSSSGVRSRRSSASDSSSSSSSSSSTGDSSSSSSTSSSTGDSRSSHPPHSAGTVLTICRYCGGHRGGGGWQAEASAGHCVLPASVPPIALASAPVSVPALSPASAPPSTPASHFLPQIILGKVVSRPAKLDVDLAKKVVRQEEVGADEEAGAGAILAVGTAGSPRLLLVWRKTPIRQSWGKLSLLTTSMRVRWVI